MLAAQLGMDPADQDPASEYRMMLTSLGGKSSAAELDPAARERVLRHLKRCASGQRPKLSQREFIELLWRQLGQAGKLDDPTPGGLSKFIYGLHRVHLASALNASQANRTIEALKAWKARSAPAR